MKKIFSLLIPILFAVNCGLLMTNGKAAVSHKSRLLSSMFPIILLGSRGLDFSKTVSPMNSEFILSTVPEQNGTGFRVQGKLKIVFTKEVDADSVQSDAFRLLTSTGSAAISLSRENNEFTISPVSVLSYGENYQLIVSGNIRDKKGSTMGSDFILNFSTEPQPDSSPLEVTSTDPLNGSAGAVESSPIKIVFNKNVNPDSLDSSFFNVSTLMGASISGKLNASGNTVTFTPDIPLPGLDTVLVTVKKNVQDFYGNTLPIDFFFSFQTANTIGPYLISSIPKNAEIEVNPYTSIQMEFSELIDPFSVNAGSILIKDSSNTTVPGIFQNNGRIIVFYPNSPLSPNSVYSVNVLSSVLDLNALNSSASAFSFQTGLFMQVTAGRNHSCFLNSKGQIRCWGKNSLGQLGVLSQNVINASEAKMVFSSSGLIASQIVSGYDHSCALFTNGSVRCWGSGFDGQLGYGKNQNIYDASSMLEIPLNSVKLIGAGNSHTCAVTVLNKVKCWGYYRAAGLLNTDIYNNAGLVPDIPLPLNAGENVIQIDGGSQHTCLLTDQNRLFCWGYRSIIDGSSTGYYDRTSGVYNVPFLAGEKPVSLSTGYSHTCAVLDDGTARCWGAGSPYIAETSSTAGSKIIFSSQIVHISAGDSHNCALLADGSVNCWGYKCRSRLGFTDETSCTLSLGMNSFTALKSSQTVNFSFPKKAVYISSGASHSCVVLNDGSLKCWGSTDSYSLGSDSVSDFDYSSGIYFTY